jgi:PKD repeat protein
VGSDSIHPSAAGDTQVADQLMAFFKTDPTAASWFLRTTPSGSAPTVTVTAGIAKGGSPLTVNFTASATDSKAAISQYLWTYDDGDFSLAQNPSKTFYAPGTYVVHLTVTDTAGNAARTTIDVTVTGTIGPPQAGTTGLTGPAGTIDPASTAQVLLPVETPSLAAATLQPGDEAGGRANPVPALWQPAADTSGHGQSAQDHLFGAAAGAAPAPNGWLDLGEAMAPLVPLD